MQDGKNSDHKKIDAALLGDKLSKVVDYFCKCYLNAVQADQVSQAEQLLKTWLGLIDQQICSPAKFEVYHQAVRTPFDYYQFGLDFIRPLINFEKSTLLGKENLAAIHKHILAKENVVLLANHQTEPDPQIISLMLQADYPQLAQEMIFVAGHRVTSDPLAVPMSLGRNLLCIYSKKHIEHPPEEKSAKITHNQRTLRKLKELLIAGGQCIYVAPSGGRDRTNEQGLPEVAAFDADSLELFHLIAKQSQSKTHFYPLALKTFALMPPPKRVEQELGEDRPVSYTPVHLNFGQEIGWDNFSGSQQLDKQSQRKMRAKYIENLVKRNYDLLNK